MTVCEHAVRRTRPHRVYFFVCFECACGALPTMSSKLFVMPLVAQTALVIPTTTLGSRYIATDINPAAVAATERTAAENGVDGVRAIRSDLVTAVADDIAGRVDVLLFNPPYVVTPSSEVGTADIVAAWAGGANGREVTDRLLPLVPALLTPETGRFYLVAIEENLQHDAIGENGLGLAS